MKFSRLFVNRLPSQATPNDTVVVIDVLRSFTTAAVALANGASAIYPVEGIAAVIALASRIQHTVSVGAVAGGDSAPGFDFGNSPSEFMQADLAGRNVVISTAAGVRGLQRFRHARQLFVASLVCARASAEAIQAAGAEDVCFVITGEWVDRDGDEDIACADYIESLLRGDSALPEMFSLRVRAADFGRCFGQVTRRIYPWLTSTSQPTLIFFEFAMAARCEGDYLVIR